VSNFDCYGRVWRRLVVTAVLCLGACSRSEAQKPTAKIAILIGSPGSKSSTLRPVYDWAIAAVNEAGGAAGRRFEATYHELDNATMQSPAAQEALATQLLAEPDLVAVAGLFSFAMAPKFVAAKVPYITPETGDDDVFRAFHEGGYVWRTLESDSTMLWFFLAEAKGRGEKAGQAETSVALLTSTDPYGQTFFDWYGFHATELGLKAFSPVQYDQVAESCEGHVDRLLQQGTPDFVIAVPSGPDPVAQATCMVRTLRARAPAATVMLADSVHVPALLTSLGADAEGLIGYHAVPDPDGGFGEAFTSKTKLAHPPEHAANTIDAIALLAYGLEKSGGVAGKDLEAGMRAVVDGRGAKARWDQFGSTMAAIRAGESPDISGASGALSFDSQVYTDPMATFYARTVVEAGAFKTTHVVTTETESSPSAVSRSAVTRGLKALQESNLPPSRGSADLPPLAENWALVVATSGTWKNYRHQADALAHYQALKANGFDDDHVVLVTMDDLASAPENLRPGEVANAADGPDVRSGAVADYRAKSLTASQLMAVLAGDSDPDLPEVLHSQAADNVYVFIVGHGGLEGPYIGLDASAAERIDDEDDTIISPTLFSQTVARMKRKGQFRRMFIVVDACHAGVLGPSFAGLEIPDVILFASAAAPESSFSANYSSRLKAWTADQFSFSLLQNVVQPVLSVHALYGRLYQQVSGSHVQVANEANFGDAAQIQLSEFVTRRAR
jgi:glycosylphosphatidylinositol transamidase (GPIT) subunit GPI8